MPQSISKQIDFLLKKGVIIANPALVAIDQTVVPEHIAPGTVMHPFCRISGSKTSIGPGCVLGAEAAVTIDNCQLGSEVKLGGGYFSGATFLDGSSMGSGAHVRPGTLAEEFSSGAQAVGLKQTVLFPYVVLGSLINFCDCLMAGGTSRKNHSEVGSSYIHFNFTPHHDKATPSLLGDVPRGVLLDQPPIFLGGQGGLVGPVRIAFGAIVPAGMIIHKDILSLGLVDNPEQAGINSMDGSFKMVGRDSSPRRSLQTKPGLSRRSVRSDKAVRPYLTKVATFIPGAYRSMARIVSNNLIYIGNIYALKMWYRHARKIFMAADPFQSACHAGALERLDIILKERISRLGELAEKMPRSIELNMQVHGIQAEPYLRQQKAFNNHWPKIRETLTQLEHYDGDTAKRDDCLGELSATGGRKPYREAIASLSSKNKASALEWLQSIVDRVSGIWKTDK